jgi:hypothetical protein
MSVIFPEYFKRLCGGGSGPAGGLRWPTASPAHGPTSVRVPCGHWYGQRICTSQGAAELARSLHRCIVASLGS